MSNVKFSSRFGPGSRNRVTINEPGNDDEEDGGGRMTKRPAARRSKPVTTTTKDKNGSLTTTTTTVLNGDDLKLDDFESLSNRSPSRAQTTGRSDGNTTTTTTVIEGKTPRDEELESHTDPRLHGPGYKKNVKYSKMIDFNGEDDVRNGGTTIRHQTRTAGQTVFETTTGDVVIPSWRKPAGTRTVTRTIVTTTGDDGESTESGGEAQGRVSGPSGEARNKTIRGSTRVQGTTTTRTPRIAPRVQTNGGKTVTRTVNTTRNSSNTSITSSNSKESDNPDEAIEEVETKVIHLPEIPKADTKRQEIRRLNKKSVTTEKSNGVKFTLNARRNTYEKPSVPAFEVEEESPTDFAPMKQQNGKSSRSISFDSNVSTANNNNNIKSDKPNSFPAEHDDWPIYKYQRPDGIACMVRASPDKIGEIRNHLRLFDGVGSETQERLPVLPAMEFDADEPVVLSPMQLSWDRSPPPDVRPIYILMPVNAMIFNEAIQQLIFMYTVDFQDWKFAEGRLLQVPVGEVLKDFYEVCLPEKFTDVVFDLKIRYLEDTLDVDENGAELNSSMEPGVKLTIPKKTFHKSTKIKIRVESLDMNETDLHTLIPGQVDNYTVLAVSPVVKVTASQATQRPIIVSVPKPGHALYGSKSFGSDGKIGDGENQKIHLYTKERQGSKYQHENLIYKDKSSQYDFSVKISKSGGSSYVFLLLTGQAPSSVEESNDGTKSFLTKSALDDVVMDMRKEDGPVRSLGRQLIGQSPTQTILTNQSELRPASREILKTWRSNKSHLDDTSLVHQLVTALKDTGHVVASQNLQKDFRRYQKNSEKVTLETIFQELSSSPAVFVNWYLLGKVLELEEEDLEGLQEEEADLQKRCYEILTLAYDCIKDDVPSSREVVLKYIAALRKIRCHRIASSVEQRHLSKFDVGAFD